MRTKFFVTLGICIALFVSAYYINVLQHLAFVCTIVFFLIVLIDYFILFKNNQPVKGERKTNERWSNGDEEKIELIIMSNSNWKMNYELIDELPIQFQVRNFSMKGHLESLEKKVCHYILTPKQRGVYEFANILLFISSPIGFLERKIIIDGHTTTKVYPAFNRLKGKRINSGTYSSEVGDHKVAKLSNSLEFDHIRDYVTGDDIRSINWKAAARRGQLMVNTFNDEQSQQVYMVFDMGRNMGLAFEGMRLNDYAINAALMLSHTILAKKDKVGLITFESKLKDFLPASKKSNQLAKLTEVLFKQESEFDEPNYEALVANVHYNVGQRSLIILFANFETLSSLERHLLYLNTISKKHVLCVIVFENEGIKTIHDSYKNSLEGIYVKTIADKFAMEKKRIIKEMYKNGILSIFTTPKQLTDDVINKYLELKSKRVI